MVWPLPTAFPMFSVSRFLPCNIPLHPWEHAWGESTSRKCFPWQYFPNKTRARRQLGSVTMRHASFANRAWLNNCISLSPSPPIALGVVNLSQANQQIFFFSSAPSHQNLVKTDCILLHRLTGSQKQDIVYVGIALSTALSIVSFPALESLLVDQLIAFCLILSTIEVNRSFFFLPKCSGKPKYLPSPPPFQCPTLTLLFLLPQVGFC